MSRDAALFFMMGPKVAGPLLAVIIELSPQIYSPPPGARAAITNGTGPPVARAASGLRSARLTRSLGRGGDGTALTAAPARAKLLRFPGVFSTYFGVFGLDRTARRRPPFRFIHYCPTATRPATRRATGLLKSRLPIAPQPASWFCHSPSGGADW